ncbi:MAG: hypothetical protein ABI208_03215 [Ginsengibacter sp.]|jgi:hypothetical protein
MRLSLRNFILFTISTCLFACSSNIKLIEKSQTKYADIRFYSEKISKNNFSIKRIYASVTANGHKRYYSFYPDKIDKTIDTAKALIYTVIYGQLPKNYDRKIFEQFSSLDSMVLKKGDKLISTLGLFNFKSSKDAVGFQIEVNYYHGYPKNQKFNP